VRQVPVGDARGAVDADVDEVPVEGWEEESMENAGDGDGEDGFPRPERHALLAFTDPVESIARQLLDPCLVGKVLTRRELEQGPCWFVNVLYAFFTDQVAWVSQRADPRRLHLVYPSVFLELRDGRVAWVHGLQVDALRTRDGGHLAREMTGPETWRWWKNLEADAAEEHEQLLAPTGTAHVLLWPSQRGWRHRTGEYEEHRRVPLDELDGARVLRVRVHRPGCVPVVNAPFYARSGAPRWGDAVDAWPADADDALDWDASALCGAPRRAIAEWLWTGEDPWVAEAQALADAEGRTLVLWPVNWSVDDTGIKTFSPVGGRELRLAYHFSDAVRVRGLPVHTPKPTPPPPPPAQTRTLRMHPFAAAPKWGGEAPFGFVFGTLFPSTVRVVRLDMLQPHGEVASLEVASPVTVRPTSPDDAAPLGVGRALLLAFPGRILTDSPQQVEACGRRPPVPGPAHAGPPAGAAGGGAGAGAAPHAAVPAGARAGGARRAAAVGGRPRQHRRHQGGAQAAQPGRRRCVPAVRQPADGPARVHPPYGNLPTDLLASAELLHMSCLGLGTKANKELLAVLRAAEGDDGVPVVRHLVRAMPRLPFSGGLHEVVWTSIRMAGARKAGTMTKAHLYLHRAAELFLGDRAPAGEEAAWARVETIREAMLLVDKAAYADSPRALAALRELARDLAPRLYAAWRDFGFAAHNAAHNFRAWQNVFDLDLRLLQDAHRMLGGAVDTFHQHFKRGARASYSYEANRGVPRIGARHPGRVPAEQPQDPPRARAAVARGVLLDNLAHYVQSALPLARGHRRSVVTVPGWRMRDRLPGTDHAGGRAPRRVLTRLYRSARPCDHAGRGTEGWCKERGGVQRGDKRESESERVGRGAGSDYHRPLPVQFRHPCLCANPRCNAHANAAIGDTVADRVWFRELVAWLVATRGLRRRWRGEEDRPRLRRPVRWRADRAQHWSRNRASFVRRRADPATAAERETTELDLLQLFGAHVCAHNDDKYRHVQYVKKLQLYQMRPDDGAVRPRTPGIGKVLGGRRTCVLRVQHSLELRDRAFLRATWPATAGGTALQPDGTLPFVCGASLPASAVAGGERRRQARCSSARRRPTRR